MMVAEELNVNPRSNTVCRRKDFGTKNDLSRRTWTAGRLGQQEDLGAKDPGTKKSRAQESPA
jgi:hypothetical protein